MGYLAKKHYSRNTFYQLAIKSWTCTHCNTKYSAKLKSCNHCDNTKFYKCDSTIESNRLQELLLLQHGKVIRNLQTQVNFRLEVNNVLICSYRADFVYHYVKSNRLVVEDIKPKSKNDIAITREFKIKQKLMGAIYGFEIQIERR